MIEGKIIAHRGVFDNNSVVENTMDSFKAALKYNYAIELDIQLTTDNQLVVFHDDTLSRLSDNNGIVQEMSYDELKKIELLKTNQHIPLLSDVLLLVKEKVLLDIEIKPTKRIKDTIEILMHELEDYDNYCIKSFDPTIIRMIKKEYPNVYTGLLITDKYSNKFLKALFKTRLPLWYSKCDFVAISKKILKNKKMMRFLLKYPILVWTIKKKEEVDYNNHIAYICNNLPYIK